LSGRQGWRFDRRVYALTGPRSLHVLIAPTITLSVNPVDVHVYRWTMYDENIARPLGGWTGTQWAGSDFMESKDLPYGVAYIVLGVSADTSLFTIEDGAYEHWCQDHVDELLAAYRLYWTYGPRCICCEHLMHLDFYESVVGRVLACSACAPRLGFARIDAAWSR
jgi:hypothetical protein